MKTQSVGDPLKLPSARMWEAVMQRDPLYGESFVYAVKSMGIYCRCTCSARRPAGMHAVEFFADADAAEQAGYRACMKCRPDAPTPWQTELRRIQKACGVLEETALRAGAAAPTLEELAAHVGDVSAHHLQKTFRVVLGVTPRQYMDAVRLRKFRAVLRQPGVASVGEAAWQAGMGAPGKRYGRPAMDLGMTPGEYRAGAPGARLRYSVVGCPLGLVLLAASDRGVCRVSLGDCVEELVDDLRREFPRAEIAPDDGSMAPWLLAILSVMGRDDRAAAVACHLPLDVQATAFQWRVWLALRSVPVGQTTTYGELATLLDCPGAARAVGSACGANPVALAIPCHRAVPASGGITGYRWKPERKAWLLAHEGKAAE